MKKVLYILKESSNSESLFPLLSEQRKNSGVEPQLVLIQPASSLAISPPVKNYTLIKMGKERDGLTPSSGDTPISYGGLLELIFSVDSIVVW